MRLAIILLAAPILFLAACGGTSTEAETMTVDAACATCIYDMEGAEGCVLAVSIDDQQMLVEGGGFNTHASGLCEEAGQVEVAGEVDGAVFKATSVTLVD